jgi:hypothetical protein
MTASTAQLTSPASEPVTAHPRSDAPSLRIWRINAMRVGYLVMAVGIALTKGPLFLQGTVVNLPVYEGVVAALLGTMGLLAVVGLRHPVQMLPILIFESTWKVVWFGAVALPHLISGDMSDQMGSVLSSVSVGILILVVTPWDYAWKRFFRTPGDKWR